MPSPEALLGERPDTPATSYRLLPSGHTVMIAAALLALAAVAWVLTVRDAMMMSGMVNGLGQVGQRMPNDMGPVAFMQMWAVMMTAMMAPTVIPVALAHRAVLRRRGEGVAPTAALVVGFLAVWFLVGLVYLVPFLWFRGLAGGAAASWWLPVVAGATLVFAGLYQFTGRKDHCTRTCCAPVAAVLRHDVGNGTTKAFRTGLRHGIHCLGCCWALMVVLLVVGLMNLAWMIGISLLFLVQKHWPRSHTFGRSVGVALILIGLFVMAKPDLLPAVSGAGA